MSHLKLRKPKAILLDLLDLLIRPDFMDTVKKCVLSPDTLALYLADNWNKPELIMDITRLRKQSELGLASSKIAYWDKPQGEIQASVKNYVIWCAETKHESDALRIFL